MEHENEEWRAAVGFPGYEISERGTVRRIADGKIISAGLGNGYPSVNLRHPNGRRTVVGVHILICAAFHGPRPTARHEVAHWDGDRLNWHPTNVRWATRKENHADKVRHGRTNRGRKAHFNKLGEEEVRKIRAALESGISQREIARRFAVTQGNVSLIHSGHIWAWLT